MRIYQLITNEGTFYLSTEPTKEDMEEYARDKRAKGFALNEILFCFAPVRTIHNSKTALAIGKADGKRRS